jgi:hypothetical protein
MYKPVTKPTTQAGKDAKLAEFQASAKAQQEAIKNQTPQQIHDASLEVRFGEAPNTYYSNAPIDPRFQHPWNTPQQTQTTPTTPYYPTQPIQPKPEMETFPTAQGQVPLTQTEPYGQLPTSPYANLPQGTNPYGNPLVGYGGGQGGADGIPGTRGPGGTDVGGGIIGIPGDPTGPGGGTRYRPNDPWFPNAPWNKPPTVPGIPGGSGYVPGVQGGSGYLQGPGAGGGGYYQPGTSNPLMSTLQGMGAGQGGYMQGGDYSSSQPQYQVSAMQKPGASGTMTPGVMQQGAKQYQPQNTSMSTKASGDSSQGPILNWLSENFGNPEARDRRKQLWEAITGGNGANYITNLINQAGSDPGQLPAGAINDAYNNYLKYQNQYLDPSQITANAIGPTNVSQTSLNPYMNSMLNTYQGAGQGFGSDIMNFTDQFNKQMASQETPLTQGVNNMMLGATQGGLNPANNQMYQATKAQLDQQEAEKLQQIKKQMAGKGNLWGGTAQDMLAKTQGEYLNQGQKTYADLVKSQADQAAGYSTQQQQMGNQANQAALQSALQAAQQHGQFGLAGAGGLSDYLTGANANLLGASQLGLQQHQGNVNNLQEQAKTMFQTGPEWLNKTEQQKQDFIQQVLTGNQNQNNQSDSEWAKLLLGLLG